LAFLDNAGSIRAWRYGTQAKGLCFGCSSVTRRFVFAQSMASAITIGPGGNLDENDIASICLRLLVNSPEIENAKEIADKLRALRDHNVASIDELALSQSEVSPTFCRKYYREHLFLISVNARKPGCVNFIVVVF